MTDVHTLATTWLLRHGGGLRRTQALTRCTAYLIAARELSEDTASRVALQALAELEAANQRARIDTVATTPHVVVVHRPDGQDLAFTVADLLRLHAQAARPCPAASPAPRAQAKLH